MHYKEIPYGFEIGAASITVCSCDERRGCATVLLTTPRHLGEKEIQIYITKSGKIRIFSEHKEWQQQA